jgi:hypothetical protein
MRHIDVEFSASSRFIGVNWHSQRPKALCIPQTMSDSFSNNDLNQTSDENSSTIIMFDAARL